MRRVWYGGITPIGGRAIANRLEPQVPKVVDYSQQAASAGGAKRGRKKFLDVMGAGAVSIGAHVQSGQANC